MNFNYTEEQVMLKDSVQRFVQTQYDFDTRRKIADSQATMDEKNWQQFAELGWLSIPFDEQYGGFGGNAMDIAAVTEELGKGLVVEPFIPTVVLFGGLLKQSANQALKDNYIPKIIEGHCLGAFAYLESQSRYQLSDIKTSANAEGDGFVISGEKVLVQNGANADVVIVSARTSGEQSSAEGISLFLVSMDSEGIEKTEYKMMDGQKVANIRFNGVAVSKANLVSEVGEGFAMMQALAKEANTAYCAEALGIMQVLNETTFEYARTREQFGVVIGKFQALQHRMVDMFMAYEQTKSLLYRVLCSWADRPEELDKDIYALKTMVARCGKLIGDEAIQLHGGMGMTDELNVGHYVKRLMMINTFFGGGDYNQSQFINLTNQ